MAQTGKHLSTMQETRVRSLGREDPLGKEMAIHSSTIAWKIPWTEEPGRLHGVPKSWTQLSDFTLPYLTLLYDMCVVFINSSKEHLRLLDLKLLTK